VGLLLLQQRTLQVLLNSCLYYACVRVSYYLSLFLVTDTYCTTEVYAYSLDDATGSPWLCGGILSCQCCLNIIVSTRFFTYTLLLFLLKY